MLSTNPKTMTDLVIIFVVFGWEARITNRREFA